MPAPILTVFNGQIKTPWRGGYTAEEQLTENTIECREEMQRCPFRLIWKNDTLAPFQFIRPGSMSPITSWGLYDGPGVDATLLVDLTSQIPDLISYFPTVDSNGFNKDYVYYLGSPLDAVLEAGTYYMRIVSGDVTYLWEPITIVCEAFTDNVFPTDSFEGGIRHEGNPDDAGWYVGRYDNTAVGVINTAGQPTNPAWEVQGNYVINIGTNSVYQYLSGAWVNDPTPATGAWFDYETGNFYQFLSGSWVGLVDPVVASGSTACWRGTFDVPIAYELSFLPCPEETMRFELTITNWTTGSLTAETEAETVAGLSGNESHQFTLFVANGYLLELIPVDGFDGCVSVRAFCPLTVSDCYYRLDWSNCGSIGNTFSGDRFTHSIYLDQAIYPVRPAPENIIESKTRADGSRFETRRRRETTWTLDLGMVPWFLADALADIPLYDAVALNPVGGGQDLLSMVRVSVENDEEFAECFKRVQITFQNEAATSACCDEFDPPCRSSCVDATGYTDGTLLDGQTYLFPGSAQYSLYTGGGLTTPTACTSGLAYFSHEDVHVLFDLNEGGWNYVAAMLDVLVTADGGGCTINILAVVAVPYRGILQYKNVDENWVDDDQYDLSALEWLDNSIQRVTPADEHADKELRIVVYIGECEIGHSAVFTYACE